MTTRASGSADVDVIVVGAGVMGTAVALELARRRREVLVLDRFTPRHDRGSSHGPSRIFRLSYEDPALVELAVESLAEWRALEEAAGEQLLIATGAVEIGEGALPGSETVRRCGRPVETLGAREAKERFGLDLPAKVPAFLYQDAGVLAAQGTVDAQARLAAGAGACFEHGVRVTRLQDGAEHIVVYTEGAVYRARLAILAAGPWLPALARTTGLTLPLAATLQQVAYLQPAPAELPVVIDHAAHSLLPAWYGAPGLRVGLASADGAAINPDDGPFDPAWSRAGDAAGWFARLSGREVAVVSMETCLYTNAPGRGFVVGRCGNIVALSACSGHGFKFAPRLAQAVADLAESREPRLPRGLAARWAASLVWTT